MSAQTLVSHRLCPYVQRIAIAITEKNCCFEKVYIDLGAKPDWFHEISPLGKVPLLIVADKAQRHVLFESAVILEYLEETCSAPLLPPDPLRRAEARSWVEFSSAILNRIGAFYNAPDENALSEEAARLNTLLRRVEDHLGPGPWFAGDQFGLVDAAFAPVFRYFDLFDLIGDLGVLNGLPRTTKWRAQLATRASVQAAVSDSYPSLLADFVARRGGELARRLTSCNAA